MSAENEMLVPAGELLEAQLVALAEARASGDLKNIEDALKALVDAGSTAHHDVREAVSLVLQSLEDAACDYVKAVFGFGDDDLSGPSGVSVMAWTNSLAAMHFVAALRFSYRHKAALFQFDESSAVAVSKLYREYRRVGSRAKLLTKIYQNTCEIVTAANQESSAIMNFEPDMACG